MRSTFVRVKTTHIFIIIFTYTSVEPYCRSCPQSFHWYSVSYDFSFVTVTLVHLSYPEEGKAVTRHKSQGELDSQRKFSLSGSRSCKEILCSDGSIGLASRRFYNVRAHLYLVLRIYSFNSLFEFSHGAQATTTTLMYCDVSVAAVAFELATRPTTATFHPVHKT